VGAGRLAWSGCCRAGLAGAVSTHVIAVVALATAVIVLLILVL
jgi:hypothetical protein